jgi:hypothetical protein
MGPGGLKTQWGELFLPRQLAVLPVDRDQKRLGEIVAGDEEEIAGEDGRGAAAEAHLRGWERMLPAKLTVEGEGRETERTQIDVDGFAVGDRGGSCGAADGVDGLERSGFERLAPENLAVLAVDGDDGEDLFVRVEGRDEEAIAPDAGRAVAGGEGDLLEERLAGPEHGR